MIPLEVDLDIDIDEPLDLEIDTRVEGGGGSLPDVTQQDERKIMQVASGRWNVQYPVLGDETLHILTNMEIETLLRNTEGGN